MANDPETRELGLRGLYLEAKRLGANEAARQYAEKAADTAPYLPWAAQATLEYRSQAGRWDDAIRLLDQQKAARVIEKEEADRLRRPSLLDGAGRRTSWKAILPAPATTRMRTEARPRIS